MRLDEGQFLCVSGYTVEFLTVRNGTRSSVLSTMDGQFCKRVLMLRNKLFIIIVGRDSVVTLELRLKKEKTYNSTPPLGLHGSL